MFGHFDYQEILRNLPYLMKVGMTFTLTLTGLVVVGGVIFGTLLAMMRLSSISRCRCSRPRTST
jgi:glutamate/aspartate transport system permease protein